MSKATMSIGGWPLFDSGHALESYRASGYDLATAIGEAIDNSLQAGATVVRVNIGRDSKVVPFVCIADNGSGIPTDLMERVLSLGYSSRYNERNGMGRFGVGMKLAALSQGRRIDVWTRNEPQANALHTFLDVDMVSRGEQIDLTATVVQQIPPEYERYLAEPSGSKSPGFATGTLVVWSKIDFTSNVGSYKASADEAITEARDFVSRAYRKFIDAGVRIYLDDVALTLHDPLFLLPNPRVERLAVEPALLPLRGTVVTDETFEIFDREKVAREVRIIVSVAPKAFRLVMGGGGKRESDMTRILAEIQGNVSLVRQGREIYYDIIPRSFPRGTTDVDRFIGVEISFPAALDESFRVRSVKRGAEPDRNLRDEIRRRLKEPILAARRMIRATFSETAAAMKSSDHYDAVASVNKTASEQQRGAAGQTADRNVEKRIVDALKDDLTGEAPSPVKVASVRKSVEEGRFEVTQSTWPGRELFALTHINGSVLIKMNNQHPILAAYSALSETNGEGDARDLLRVARYCIDALLLGYAKAESFDRDPDEKYGNLRTFWGAYSAQYFERMQRSGERGKT